MGMANFKNRTLFHGDNLGFLRGINSETVHLIATDPPFNKDRDFHATPDSLAAGAKFQDRWSWEDDVEGEWVDQIQDDWPAVWKVIDTARTAWGDDMGAFLCFMGVRLIEMRRVLRKDGSIYLHCDDTAVAYLKVLMDSIFESKHLQAHIVWRRATSHNDPKRWGRILDHILHYSSSQQITWNGQDIATPKSAEQLKKAYPSRDERFSWLGPVRQDNLTGPSHGSNAGSPSTLPWREYDVHSRGRVWSAPRKGRYAEFIEANFIPGYRSIQGVHERLDALDDAGLIHHPAKGFWPGLKRYAAADQGNPPQNLILSPTGFTNFTKQHGEAVGYPTQKPLALYERFIKASSNEGDIVLDPFCGCATTPVAAERLKRQWVGIDIWNEAHRLVLDRFKAEGLMVPDGESIDKTEQLRMISFGEVHYETDPPIRTDDRDSAVPAFQVTERYPEPPGPRMSRAEMLDHLIAQHGAKCQGCDREFDDPRYLQLDHNTPRADGGLNHITNRVLLCGPCNQLKSNVYTLSGLRRENRKRGYMAP
ncbi:MAG: hypothetical protein F4Z31_21460 [Gemmatimonadetes bacterium]|nr:hypothetical protein [Gemmatimonadota bacterium]